MEETQVAVIGAGPHGLSAAAHLRRAGVECRLLGDPMSFWMTMPSGMLLRSNETRHRHRELRRAPLSLDAFLRAPAGASPVRTRWRTSSPTGCGCSAK